MSAGFGAAAGAVGGLLGGISDRRAAKGANKFSKQQTKHALTELSPQAIQQMIQMFLKQNMGSVLPYMQASLGGLAGGAAKAGLTGAGVIKQLQAGIPGQAYLGALRPSISEGTDIAKNRAATWMGQKYTPMGNWAGITAKMIAGAMNGMQGQAGSGGYTQY